MPWLGLKGMQVVGSVSLYKCPEYNMPQTERLKSGLDKSTKDRPTARIKTSKSRETLKGWDEDGQVDDIYNLEIDVWSRRNSRHSISSNESRKDKLSSENYKQFVCYTETRCSNIKILREFKENSLSAFLKHEQAAARVGDLIRDDEEFECAKEDQLQRRRIKSATNGILESTKAFDTRKSTTNENNNSNSNDDDATSRPNTISTNGVSSMRRNTGTMAKNRIHSNLRVPPTIEPRQIAQRFALPMSKVRMKTSYERKMLFGYQGFANHMLVSHSAPAAANSKTGRNAASTYAPSKFKYTPVAGYNLTSTSSSDQIYSKSAGGNTEINWTDEADKTSPPSVVKFTYTKSASPSGLSGPNFTRTEEDSPADDVAASTPTHQGAHITATEPLMAVTLDQKIEFLAKRFNLLENPNVCVGDLLTSNPKISRHIPVENYNRHEINAYTMQRLSNNVSTGNPAGTANHTAAASARVSSSSSGAQSKGENLSEISKTSSSRNSSPTVTTSPLVPKEYSASDVIPEPAAHVTTKSIGSEEPRFSQEHLHFDRNRDGVIIMPDGSRIRIDYGLGNPIFQRPKTSGNFDKSKQLQNRSIYSRQAKSAKHRGPPGFKPTASKTPFHRARESTQKKFSAEFAKLAGTELAGNISEDTSAGNGINHWQSSVKNLYNLKEDEKVDSLPTNLPKRRTGDSQQRIEIVDWRTQDHQVVDSMHDIKRYVIKGISK